MESFHCKYPPSRHVGLRKAVRSPVENIKRPMLPPCDVLYMMSEFV